MKKTNEKTVLKKRVKRKHVQILESEMVEKMLVTKYKKWQLFLAKLIKVEVNDAYTYLYRIRYKGSVKLKKNDVVFNSEQVLFGVLQENNRFAMISTAEAFVRRPKVYGNLTILEKSKSK